MVVLAFAGHGLQFEGQKDAFFCPRDAKPFREDSATLVSMAQVFGDLERCFAGAKILLVDACRNDPKVSRGIHSDNVPRPSRGVAVLFSCSAGEVAFEHPALEHGVFFHYVLEGLRGEARKTDGQVTFHSLADYVSEKVPERVPDLVGEGAQQSPNTKLEWHGPSPVLLARAATNTPPPPSTDKPFKAVALKKPPMPDAVPALKFTQGTARIESALDAAPAQVLAGNKAYKEYTFHGEAGKTYQIDLSSKDFDAYLFVKGTDGKTLAENDDAEPGTQDARIRLEVYTSGTFHIVATSLEGGSGAFTLTVVEQSGAPPAKADPDARTGPAITIEVVFTNRTDQQVKFFLNGGAGLTTTLDAGQSQTFDMVVDPGVEAIVGIYQASGKRLDFTIPSRGRYAFQAKDGEIQNFFD